MNIFIIANVRTHIDDYDSLLDDKAAKIYKDGDKIFRLKKYQTSKCQDLLKDKPCTRIVENNDLFFDLDLKKLKTNAELNAPQEEWPTQEKWRQYYTNRKGWRCESETVGVCGLNVYKWSNNNKIDMTNISPIMSISQAELQNEGLMLKYPYTNIIREDSGRVRLKENTIDHKGLEQKQYIRRDGLYDPSFGIMVAFWCSRIGWRYNHNYHNYHIYLVGFSFGKKGSPCLRHDWKSEKDWCNSQENVSII